MVRKKRVLLHSNFCKMFTGFGKNKKNILRYLFDTDKYEVIELANGKDSEDEELGELPWKAYGSIPMDKYLLSQLQNDKQASAKVSYGYYNIDSVIKEVKPDIYIGMEDIWGLGFWKKDWWKILSPIIWTTLDSLPILPDAIDAAKHTEHFYTWAEFAEREMNNLGYENVKTLHGSIICDDFYPLPNDVRTNNRNSFGISNEEFIIGFVFRNQLRKSVPNLLEGFKYFIESSECKNAKLLLHTNWTESWDIQRLMSEFGIEKNKVLATYVCKECGQYHIQPYSGEGIDCPYCGAKSSMNTVSIKNGVSEKQLNEIYNLMDVYCHPFTSGGQEIPIQEAKLSGLITLVTDYSCGEEHAKEENGGFALEWSEYREPSTHFIKASTDPNSITEKLRKVYFMDAQTKKKMIEDGINFVKNEYSVDVIGKKLEEILDKMPIIEESKWESLSDDSDNPLSIKDFLDENKKRILIAIPQGAIDVMLLNRLMGGFKKKYKNYDIYFATDPKFFNFIENNENLHKVIPFHPIMENILEMEGSADHEGLFEAVFLPHIRTQKIPNYTHNGIDN